MQIFKCSQKETEGERQKKIIMPPLPILDLWKERQERERDRRETGERDRRERERYARDPNPLPRTCSKPGDCVVKGKHVRACFTKY